MKRYILCILTLFLFFSCKESSPVSVIKESTEVKFDRLVWIPEGDAMVSWFGRRGGVDLYINDIKIEPKNEVEKQKCIVFDYPEPTTVESIKIVSGDFQHVIKERLHYSPVLIPTNLIVEHDDSSVDVDEVYPVKSIPTNPWHQEYYHERNRYIDHEKPYRLWKLTWDIPEDYLSKQSVVVDYNGNHKKTFGNQIDARMTSIELFQYRDEECEKENYEDRGDPVWVLKNHYANQGATESTVTITVNLFSTDWKEKGVLEVPVSITKPINP